MHPKILANFTILILMVSGLTGFFIDEGFLIINKSILNLILDVALLIIGIFSIQNTQHYRQLLVIISLFFLSTLISATINVREFTYETYVNGLRDFFPYFLFPIVYLNIFRSNWKIFFIKKFNIFLYIFLTLQIPISLYQYSINGAGDTVGGTQGAGFSGILTFIVFLATYYLMTQGLDERAVFKTSIKKSYLFIFWLPAFINETKISFFLIILFFLLLSIISISNIWKYVLASILIIPLLIVFNSFYESTTGNSYMGDVLDKDNLEQYLTSDDENYTDIPRFQKIAIFITTFDTQEILLGKGLGQFKGGTTIELTPFATSYEWLLSGSRPMLFFLFIQVGLIGTILFLSFWIKLISMWSKKNNLNYSINIILFCTASFILIQMYNDSLRSLFFCGIIMFILTYAISGKQSSESYNRQKLIRKIR